VDQILELVEVVALDLFQEDLLRLLDQQEVLELS
jgi:hypothetical protein